jgi:hypothetical protein
MLARVARSVRPRFARSLSVKVGEVSYDQFVEIYEQGLSLQASVEGHLPAIEHGLKEKGFHVVNGLIGAELCAQMRKEVRTAMVAYTCPALCGAWTQREVTFRVGRQAEEMHRRGKFEASYSEVAETGGRTFRSESSLSLLTSGKRIWRDNVYAAEAHALQLRTTLMVCLAV